MKALIISDTHGNSSRAFSAHALSGPVDAIIHLGDGSDDAELLREMLDIPVINVAGNCDTDLTVPRERVWECEGKRILLTHGDAYHVKSGLARLHKRAEEIGVDAVLFGHTHQRVAENCDGIMMINPGTLSNAALQRSYAVLDVTPDSINFRHYDGD